MFVHNWIACWGFETLGRKKIFHSVKEQSFLIWKMCLDGDYLNLDAVQLRKMLQKKYVWSPKNTEQSILPFDVQSTAFWELKRTALNLQKVPEDWGPKDNSSSGLGTGGLNREGNICVQLHFSGHGLNSPVPEDWRDPRGIQLEQSGTGEIRDQNEYSQSSQRLNSLVPGTFVGLNKLIFPLLP